MAKEPDIARAGEGKETLWKYRRLSPSLNPPKTAKGKESQGMSLYKPCGLGFRVSWRSVPGGASCSAQKLELGSLSFPLGVSGLRFRVEGFRVQGLGF